jgi:cytidylate kinase
MDGRDIGTVVFPDARLKIFMTARPEVRAARRYAEMQAKGAVDGLSLDEVAANLMQRDAEDQARLDSPLLQAQDARVLDNSDLTFDEAVDLALGWAQERGFQPR